MKRIVFIILGIFLTAGAFAANVSKSDQRFLSKAAQAGFTEVQGSTLAQSKASSSEVKSFADQMIKDHTAANNELNQLAASKGVKVPTEPSLTQRGKLKLLSSYSGNNFDKHYADQIGVNAHEDTIKLFQKASTNARDPDVKAFATKTLPTLQHHLEMAKSLQASLKNANSAQNSISK